MVHCVYEQIKYTNGRCLCQHIASRQDVARKFSNANEPNIVNTALTSTSCLCSRLGLLCHVHVIIIIIYIHYEYLTLL